MLEHKLKEIQEIKKGLSIEEITILDLLAWQISSLREFPTEKLAKFILMTLREHIKINELDLLQVDAILTKFVPMYLQDITFIYLEDLIKKNKEVNK